MKQFNDLRYKMKETGIVQQQQQQQIVNTERKPAVNSWNLGIYTKIGIK